jgi:imidazolonepropionase-like amidohydrolase
MAGNAVANGMPYPAALAALTINPARMFGIDQRLGSLEKGKAADVVVWDGDPLEVSSRPLAVFIDGVAMNMENRQTKLRDRYRDLSRGDLPFAYRGAKP